MKFSNIQTAITALIFVVSVDAIPYLNPLKGLKASKENTSASLTTTAIVVSSTAASNVKSTSKSTAKTTETAKQAKASSDSSAKSSSDSAAKTTGLSASATKKASSGTASADSSTKTTAAAAAGGALPASSGTSVLSAAQTIAAGGSFDGGMVMFDRGVSCTGQAEGGDSDAVFNIEAGGSLSNVIIGPNQIEGVHCQGGCTLTNVWWSAVCEDAFSVKVQDAGETTKITGGGAFGATDKVVQHNGAGTVSISGFTVETFGKLYRSCGNCKTMYERHVIMDSISATDGTMLAGINSNYGDSATLTGITVSGVDDVCVTFTGTDNNSQEPVENGSGADGTYCIYTASDATSS